MSKTFQLNYYAFSKVIKKHYEEFSQDEYFLQYRKWYGIYLLEIVLINF